MEITPHLGIGDLLIIKMKEISNNLNIKNININVNLIKEYSENYELKLLNSKNLISILFPYSNVKLNNGPCDFYIFDNYKLNKTYIFNYIKFNHVEIKKYCDYIIFHTKFRHDSLIDKFKNEIMEYLNIFFENFKTSKTIIILGEKIIGVNVETQAHKTISLYENLLLLKKNNNVLDFSTDILTSGNENFDNFLFDIEIINKSNCNITFGIGGPLNICKAFSEKNVSFIPFLNLSPFKNVINQIMKENNSLVENIEEFSEKINLYL